MFRFRSQCSYQWRAPLKIPTLQGVGLGTLNSGSLIFIVSAWASRRSVPPLCLLVSRHDCNAAVPGKRSYQLQQLPHPAARLRETKELPRENGPETWGGAGFIGGDDGQSCTEERGEKKEEGIALAMLSSPQVRVLERQGYVCSRRTQNKTIVY